MVSGVICNLKVPIKLKEEFYHIAIQLAILYGNEYWTLSRQEKKSGSRKNKHVKMGVATRKDRMRNDCIWRDIGVENIEGNITKNWLSWFGHIKRRPQEAVVRRVNQMGLSPVKRGRGDQKRLWGRLSKRISWWIISLRIWLLTKTLYNPWSQPHLVGLNYCVFFLCSCFKGIIEVNLFCKDLLHIIL